MPRANGGCPGKGPAGGIGGAKAGGGGRNPEVAGEATAGNPGGEADGAVYACGGAPYTALVAGSGAGGIEGPSAAPIKALCASNCAFNSSSESGLFSTLGRLVWG